MPIREMCIASGWIESGVRCSEKILVAIIGGENARSVEKQKTKQNIDLNLLF